MLQSEKIKTNKLPLSYRVQLISGLFALLCIPMIFIAEATGWFEDELFHLPQWTAIAVCFVSGIVAYRKKRACLGRFHKIVSSLEVALSGMFLIFFCILMGVLMGPDIINSIKYHNFDKQVWTQDEESVARAYMADSLIRKKTLIGLKEEEVVELLGEPIERDPSDGSTFPFGAFDCDIHYYLGPERGFLSIDSEWLFITFDESGKVNHCWLYTD